MRKVITSIEDNRTYFFSDLSLVDKKIKYLSVIIFSAIVVGVIIKWKFSDHRKFTPENETQFPSFKRDSFSIPSWGISFFEAKEGSIAENEKDSD
jgi:hypothetical protein